jgi:hypothetical protein
MFLRSLFAAAPLLLAFAPLQAAPAVSVEEMRRHIEVLASDAFEGRKPGTAGENRTIAYIAQQFQATGLEPAADGGWYQPVPLVERKPFAHRLIWTADGAPLPFDQANAVFIGEDAVERIADAPVLHVGYGLPGQIAGADLTGAVAILLYDAPEGEGFPSFSERVRGLVAAGAAAVIGTGDAYPWSAIRGSFERGQTRFQSAPAAPIQGAIPLAEAQRLADLAGADVPLVASANAERPIRLPLRATIDVSTQVNAYTSHNVIGRLEGSAGSDESVMYLGHWDHFGICRPDDPDDKICNGAVDNASGIAMLIEIARHIAEGERPERDLLFMATTAEEVGLLGAEYFAANPTVKLPSIVAAINIDTVAIHDAGEPVAIVGRGTTPLDPIVDATARELGRAIDSDAEANAFVERQDGWELTRAGVPTVMVGGSFANMASLGAFLSGPYHQPDDDLDRPFKLEGAAEDADLMIALGRKLADTDIYQPPAR